MISLRLLLPIVIISLLFFKSLAPIEVEGSSNSFPRQELRDDRPYDWEYYPLFARSNCTDEIRQSIQVPDIEGVSYFSDGNYLNATIWLSGPFEERPIAIARAPLYFMTVGIAHSNDISFKKDYAVSIQWDALNTVWIKTIQEYLMNGTKTLVEDKNYLNFYENTGNKGHIDLSLDLRKITSPKEYIVSFGVVDSVIKSGNVCGLVDVIENAGYVPPPQFRLSTFPAPLEIRQGEEKTIELRINSTTLATPRIDLKPDLKQAPDGMGIRIVPDKIEVPPAGVAASHIRVNVSDKVPPGPHTIPIMSTISFPSIVDISPLINSSNNNTVVRQGSNIPENNDSSLATVPTNISLTTISPRPSSFTVIVEPYPFQEQFKDFWGTYGDMISLIGGGFAAGLSALLIDRFRSRSRYKSKKIDDYY